MTNDDRQRASEIAAINDCFRISLGIAALNGNIPGHVLKTAGIDALPLDQQAAILSKVREFNTFTEDDDPYGEHTISGHSIGGEKIFWKIDYYAPDMHSGSEDPADLSKTVRVLTRTWELPRARSQ